MSLLVGGDGFARADREACINLNRGAGQGLLAVGCYLDAHRLDGMRIVALRGTVIVNHVNICKKVDTPVV